MNTLTHLSMSSTEIAALTGKEKTHIHRDIKAQLLVGLYGLKDDPILDDEQIQGLTVVFDNRNYWSEVLLDRYHTDILISGYEVKYRAAIVKRWHELEAKKPLTQIELLVQSALALQEQERRLSSVEQELKALSYEMESKKTAVDYFTVIGYASYKKLSGIDLSTASKLGKLATKYCKDLGIKVDITPDPRFGRVNVYPRKILDEVFTQLNP